MAFNAQDEQQVELARLRRELLSFLVAELGQLQPDGQPHPLTGTIAAAIATEANHRLGDHCHPGAGWRFRSLG